MGKMGSGKTLSMSVLAEYIAWKTGAPLFANYTLANSAPVNSLYELYHLESGIFCFDEIWLTMDSRLWKDNVKLTRWINQTRKKKLIVFYTTQHIRQVELRCRTATDIVIFTEKRRSGIALTFIDYQYNLLGKTFLIDRPQRFYGLYDTFEVLKPIQISKND